MKPIRLHEPNISGNEFSYVNECLVVAGITSPPPLA